MANFFPLATELWGRSIIVPGLDENYERVMVSTADISKDKGIPQSFYMHNCMPTAHGYQAIGWDKVTEALANSGDFDFTFPIQNVNLNRFIYVPAQGKNYIWNATLGTWTSVSPFPPGLIPFGTLITVAFVQGQSYIYIDGLGCYIYDEVNEILVPQVFTGVNAANIHGICAANGYLIIWNDTAVAWSSTINPLDFSPSLITGAGGGNINDAKGAIVACLPIANGFIVYCKQNAVGAKYSGNINFPFSFYELSGSGGITSPEDVSWQANLGYHYAWTTFGLQQLDLNSAAFVFPEVSDFLSALIYEDFDETSQTFTTTYTTSPLTVKLTVVEDGYLIISYGIAGGPFTYALIYDMNLQRWGKVKVTHVDVYQWNTPNIYGVITWTQLLGTSWFQLGPTTWNQLFMLQNSPDLVRKTIAFIDQNGKSSLMNFDLSEIEADGVLLLGKYQFQRNKRILHQVSEVEVVEPGLQFSLTILPTYDGKTFVKGLPAVQIPVPGQDATMAKTKRMAAMIEGQNVSLLFTGAFNLTSVVSDFTSGGQW